LSTTLQQVQSTFRDFEECNILCPYMSDTIKEIAKACQTLEGKDSSPTAGICLLIRPFPKSAKFVLYPECVYNYASKIVAHPSFSNDEALRSTALFMDAGNN
jgi:hypothetical protein